MAVVKRSVAFAEEVAAEADALAGERGFSRLVNDALEQHLQAIRIATLHDEFVAEHGAIGSEVRRSVSDEWATQLRGG